MRGAGGTQSRRWPGVLWTLPSKLQGTPAFARSPGRGGALDAVGLGAAHCSLGSPSPPCGPQTRWPHPDRTQSGLGGRTFWSQGTGVRLSFKQRWNAGRLPPFSLPILNLGAGVNRAWQPPDLRDPRALNREARVCKGCFSLHSNFNTNKRILFQGQRRKS